MGNCIWPRTTLEQAYHDQEWCRPKFDDREIFEWLTLELMQAGLSWRTVLDKREAMRQAFDNFDPEIIRQYDENKWEALMNDAGIIRNRMKIQAVIKNAHAFARVQEEWESFAHYIWHFVDYKPIMNTWKENNHAPSQSDLSRKVSKSMKQYGFSFVGPTIAYSFLQAVGLVNDHLIDCEHYDLVAQEVKKVQKYFAEELG